MEGQHKYQNTNCVTEKEKQIPSSERQLDQNPYRVSSNFTILTLKNLTTKKIHKDIIVTTISNFIRHSLVSSTEK